MKFTKKEISDIKYFFTIIKNRIKKSNEKLTENLKRNNWILYGVYAGRIFEIIHRRIDFKREEKNLNADNLILELFGQEFFNWLTFDHKQFTYLENTNQNKND